MSEFENIPVFIEEEPFETIPDESVLHSKAKNEGKLQTGFMKNVKMTKDSFMQASCTCPIGQKEYLCKHILGLAI